MTGSLPRDVARVVIVVFDGLRPDPVTADTTPHLHRCREQSAAFVAARSVCPSGTRVCRSAIATGAPPAVHGIVGNAFFPPAMSPALPDAGLGRLLRCQRLGEDDVSGEIPNILLE